MDLQELAERIQRWKAKVEKGGRDVEEIIQEEPVEIQTSKAPDSLWQQHEATEDTAGTLDGTLQSAEEYTPESLDDAAEVVEATPEEAPAEEEAVAEEEAATVEEVAADEAPVEAVEAEPEMEPEMEPETEIEAAEVESVVESVVESEDEDHPVDSTTEINIDSMEEIK